MNFIVKSLLSGRIHKALKLLQGVTSFPSRLKENASQLLLLICHKYYVRKRPLCTLKQGVLTYLLVSISVFQGFIVSFVAVVGCFVFSALL